MPRCWRTFAGAPARCSTPAGPAPWAQIRAPRWSISGCGSAASAGCAWGMPPSFRTSARAIPTPRPSWWRKRPRISFSKTAPTRWRNLLRQHAGQEHMSELQSSVASGTAGLDVAPLQSASLVERWYVLIMMCLVYTLSIADRYVVSTVLDPIRVELHLTDQGVAWLTGAAFGLFYVVLGFPLSWLIDRKNRRNIVAACLVLWSIMTAVCGLARTSWQVFFPPRRGTRRRSRWHAGCEFAPLRLLPREPARYGAHGVRARRADRRVGG